MKKVFSYAGIFLGSFIFAIGLNLFFISNELAEGGLTGFTLIIHYLTGWPVSIMLVMLNIPLLLLGWIKWGLPFIFKTLLAIVTVSVAVDLTQQFHFYTKDLLLAALYGGVFSGFGTGLVLRSGATTGGLDILARLFRERYGISMGKVFFSFDVTVLLIFTILFGPEKALYTLVALFVFSQVIDRTIEGINEATAVMIISQNTAALTQVIINELDRGATIIKGYGAYTGQERDILYVVLGKSELLSLKKIVQYCDPHAFVTVTGIHEVLGEGFRRPL